MTIMDWQPIAVGVFIAAALGYVLLSTWRTWFGRSAKGCASGCGKCAAEPPAPVPGRRSLL